MIKAKDRRADLNFSDLLLALFGSALQKMLPPFIRIVFGVTVSRLRYRRAGNLGMKEIVPALQGIIQQVLKTADRHARFCSSFELYKENPFCFGWPGTHRL